MHPSPPEPGTYILPLTGIDIDNELSYPFNLYLEVSEIPDLRFSMTSSSVLVSPESPTLFDLEVHNDGNSDQGWNLYLESPSGWQSGYDDLGSRPGAPSGSTGAIAEDSSRLVGITIYPPQVMVAAGHGHSVALWDVDPSSVNKEMTRQEIEEAMPFVHGTQRHNAETIRREGLRRVPRDGTKRERPFTSHQLDLCGRGWPVLRRSNVTAMDVLCTSARLITMMTREGP